VKFWGGRNKKQDKDKNKTTALQLHRPSLWRGWGNLWRSSMRILYSRSGRCEKYDEERRWTAELHESYNSEHIFQLVWFLSNFYPRSEFRIQGSESLGCDDGAVLSVTCHKHYTQLRFIMRKLHICVCDDGLTKLHHCFYDVVWPTECQCSLLSHNTLSDVKNKTREN
jgi:hypothetical protein